MKKWNGEGIPQPGEHFEINIYDRSGDDWQTVKAVATTRFYLVYSIPRGNEFTRCLNGDGVTPPRHIRPIK